MKARTPSPGDRQIVGHAEPIDCAGRNHRARGGAEAVDRVAAGMAVAIAVEEIAGGVGQEAAGDRELIRLVPRQRLRIQYRLAAGPVL